MLGVGRDRLLDSGCGHNIRVVQVNAEALPFADNSFNCIIIAFGLRNVTDKDKALRSMLRVLKPGGRLLVLEFSKPIHEPLSKLYDLYSFKDRKSTRLNSSHVRISYAVFCLKKKKKKR